MIEVKRDFIFLNCQLGEHVWKVEGWRRCGCNELGCYCSIPVRTCTVCGDCDYGDNPEARQIEERCTKVADAKEEMALEASMDKAWGETMDDLDHAYRLEQETPEGGATKAAHAARVKKP